MKNGITQAIIIIHLYSRSFTQLTEVTLSLFGRQFGGGCKHMQPSQDMDARILTALVLHVVLAIFSKQRDPVLKPFVSILDSPATMVVSCNKLRMY